ncbi:MAG: transposase [Leptolyngbyaceae cyanobacterium]
MNPAAGGVQPRKLNGNQLTNRFRLLLVQAAYLLMITLRHAAEGTDLATAQVVHLRIKVGARVKTSTRRVLVELVAFCPFAQAMKQIAHRLGDLIFGSTQPKQPPPTGDVCLNDENRGRNGGLPLALILFQEADRLFYAT